tara:strand:+ start:502 stop:888 length:387 start_codon:yes stop_codon:yes gene_type:complete
MKLTENFNLSEFQCKCGCEMPAFVKENIQELALNLQMLRDIVGALNLTNAYRCKEHNLAVGGSVKSQHLVGKAADIQSIGAEPSEIANITEVLMDAKKLKAGGIGRYNTFTHIDIRGSVARWDKTSNK